MNEFEIIERYFNFSKQDAGVITGIGDDAAVIHPDASPIAISVDTLVAGVHFPLESSPADIAYKALAVNLSDLAAMGAEPRWFTLSLVLPDADDDWLDAFALSLSDIAKEYNIALIGGDTTRGPLTITIQVMGALPNEGGILRSTARPEEDIYVTGTIGDAAIGLLAYQEKITLANEEKLFCIERLSRPTPRLTIGQALINHATSMIDCSDGFAADLGHILQASGVGAEVSFASLPLSPAGNNWIKTGKNPELIINGGDDYELIFTAPRQASDEIKKIAVKHNVAITHVGSTTDNTGLRFFDAEDRVMSLTAGGYNHFKN
jgi:thiamine-monophosphate kinase